MSNDFRSGRGGDRAGADGCNVWREDDDTRKDAIDDEDEESFLVLYNREYREIDTSFTNTVADVIEIERHLLSVVRTGVPPELAVARHLADDDTLTAAEAEEFMWELPATTDEENPFAFLDLGVVSVVVALAEAGAMPYASCNGGLLGEAQHVERFPLVAILTDPGGLVERVATEHGLEYLPQEVPAGAVIFADDLEAFLRFAAALAEEEETESA